MLRFRCVFVEFAFPFPLRFRLVCVCVSARVLLRFRCIALLFRCPSVALQCAIVALRWNYVASPGAIALRLTCPVAFRVIPIVFHAAESSAMETQRKGNATQGNAI
jgi:hypothetical protein